jgi:hypothetical protein
MSAEVQTALANEARRNELKNKLSKLRGATEATASLMSRISSVNNDALMQIEGVTNELAALEAGAGPGITADYGSRSRIAQLLDVERFAAKEGSIDYVKANPEASEQDAIVAWDQAALASHPTLPVVLQNGGSLSALYRINLLTGGYIEENSWEAHRQFILNTDRAVLLAL